MIYCYSSVASSRSLLVYVCVSSRLDDPLFLWLDELNHKYFHVRALRYAKVARLLMRLFFFK